MTMLTRPASSRRLVLAAAVSVALISTVGAYLAMVAFGIDVLAMDAATAYATAGVFELSLVTVALLAREAAKDNRPGGTLLTLTWALSSASGAFAAWHEIFIGHPLGAAVFRFLVPLLAALMWHLALIGDRHLATGQSWTGARQARRMHALFLATEDLFRAQHLGGRRLAAAEARRRRARAVALRTVPPEAMRGQVTTWVEALGAVGEGTADVARLHTEDRARLSAILTPGQTTTPASLSAPDSNPDAYAIEAAGHVAAEVADITTDTARVRAGQNRRTAAAGQARGASRATARTRRTPRPAGADKAARLAIVSALLTDRPDATASAAMSVLSEAGHDVTDRTARRLLSEARAAASASDAAANTTPDADTTTTTHTTDTTAPTAARVLAEVN
ncbi:hypothetical protein [Myceligenerans salitolerans]|uniref:DUF2637 domain-containing protein n=1 Tax=Myceligenerans salitolerans TaxID=1230528 RepID=A0ABS3IEN0_9MICO|nr:hypothetical protein [Myceligenerans salitolerans]MBO0611101.1 hypothetical protein [Myceligenerans salitolerans]